MHPCRSTHLKLYLAFWSLIFIPVVSSAQARARVAPADEAAIRAVFQKQVDDWNRGDIDSFATGYKNSPDILFIGSTMHRGYDGMLAGYHQSFRTRASMGNLSFAALEIQPLDAHFATATGRFSLQRTPEGGGNSTGHFLLVLEKTPAGWKIVRDATTTELPAAVPPRH
jgi:uncharacterized protein (TIGR02246 family)